MNGIDCLITCEQRIREHYKEVAHNDADEWQAAKTRRRFRTVLALALVALAVHMDQTLVTPTGREEQAAAIAR